jgi:adenylosuccinate synthase
MSGRAQRDEPHPLWQSSLEPAPVAGISKPVYPAEVAKLSGVVAFGMQWGDEGKGKIVDWLASRADIVVRFNGGSNAGHTLNVEGREFRLSMLPSGVVRSHTINVLGSGVVVDPERLLDELDALARSGIKLGPERLRIAESASLILSVHRLIDGLRESGGQAVGTTGRGIAPAYEDKVARRAVRVCDLADQVVLERNIERLARHHDVELSFYGQPPLDRSQLLASLRAAAPRVTAFASPVWADLAAWAAAGKHVLFEGAQGAILDVDYGTYPYVTSSNTFPGQAAAGGGVPASSVRYTLGISKAYSTRVGNGPYPTELHGEAGHRLREAGHEYGTMTGRERRCGWFDAVLARQVVKIAGVDGIALTKLDILDGFDEIPVCTSYAYRGSRLDHMPASESIQAELRPVYETLPGWKQRTFGTRSFGELPTHAQAYVRRLEQLVGAPVVIVSTGPGRDDTIELRDPFGGS